MAAVSTCPFSQAVVNAVRKLYPESIADKSWDNTGLLLESPCRKPRKNHSALLTNDLTRAVADEAIRRGDSIIVAYHPIIFRGLKSITLGNPQQDTLLRLAAEGISVYSPHTALDAAPGGMCDWLSDIIVADSPQPAHLKNAREKLFKSAIAIEPIPNPPAGFEAAGMGRLITLSEPQSLRTLKNQLLHNLGRNALSLAIPQTKKIDDINEIRTIAVCPGSGASLLMRNGKPIADLLVTGEMSHHDALAAIEQGSCVMTVFHSNSERGYIQGELRRRLTEELATAWPKWRATVAQTGQWPEEALGGDDFEVEYSRVDGDPYHITMGE